MKFIRLSFFGTLFWISASGQMLAIEKSIETFKKEVQKNELQRLFESAEEAYRATAFQKAIERYYQLLKVIETQLGSLEPIAVGESLLFEIAYLQGEAAFHRKAFKKAIDHFERALRLLPQDSQTKTFYQTLSYLGWAHLKVCYESQQPPFDQQKHHLNKAEKYFGQLLKSQSEESASLAMIHGYLKAINACYLSEENAENQELACTAEQILLKVLNDYPFSEACLKLLGTFYLRRAQFDQAKSTFNSFVELHPQSQFAPEAFYWHIYCSEKLEDDPISIQSNRKRLYESYPDSPFAADAYFHCYSYRQYLQGDRDSIKHLQLFVEKFPNTPLLIIAHYLMGLDYKRERKSAEGRSIRKKNDIKAMNHFFKAETLFDKHYQAGCSQQQTEEFRLAYYAMIRYCAMLERALCNQAIADDSQAAKRAIYSQSAQELLLQMNRELADQNHLVGSCMTKDNPFPKIHQKSLYYLVQSYNKCGNFKAANRAIQQILAKYAFLKIKSNYYLACIYYEKGVADMRQGNFELALKALNRAEKSDQGRFLSTHQKLELWIQQSMCYKALYQTDQAMQILSKVINENTFSSLRVKAMFLRAEVYALQGRHELARKQLESTAKKGGEWAMKAKIKLDEEYGY